MVLRLIPEPGQPCGSCHLPGSVPPAPAPAFPPVLRSHPCVSSQPPPTGRLVCPVSLLSVPLSMQRASPHALDGEPQDLSTSWHLPICPQLCLQILGPGQLLAQLSECPLSQDKEQGRVRWGQQPGCSVVPGPPEMGSCVGGGCRDPLWPLPGKSLSQGDHPAAGTTPETPVPLWDPGRGCSDCPLCSPASLEGRLGSACNAHIRGSLAASLPLGSGSVTAHSCSVTWQATACMSPGAVGPLDVLHTV